MGLIETLLNKLWYGSFIIDEELQKMGCCYFNGGNAAAASGRWIQFLYRPALEF